MYCIRLASWTVAFACALPASSVFAADISAAQKDGICRVSLARINGNAPRDYQRKRRVADTFTYASARGYIYDCEVFSDGMAFTLSNEDWGRLRPTGSVKTVGKCSSIRLFDPGFGLTHELRSCVP